MGDAAHADVFTLASTDPSGPIPPSLIPYLNNVDEGYRIVGDRTAYRDVYVWTGASNRVALSTDLTALLDHIVDTGERLTMDEFGLAAMLANGLVPLPHSMYNDVHMLSMGDVLDVRFRSGRVDLEWSVDYPWTESRTTESEDPDPRHMLNLLVAATEKQYEEHGREGVLLLSGGMDSPSVALALREAGITNVPAITYRADPQNPEPEIAAGIARRLGIAHEVVDIPDDPSTVSELLTEFFRGAPLPGVDQSQIPYIVAAAASGMYSGALYDGGGNDSYFNYPTSSGSRRKRRYRLRGRALQRSVRRVAPVDSPANYLARNRLEVLFPGRLPRGHHIRKLRPDTVDIHGWWDEEDKRTSDVKMDDIYDLYLRRHIHAGQVLLKQRLTAASRGMGTALPWCDDALADYCFNLPVEQRYDQGRTKVILRDMLANELDYDADAIGKHYFLFDGAAFILRNRDFVISEIERSPLWAEEGVAMVRSWIAGLDRRPMRFHAVLAVFMISGWSNHSRHARIAIGT